MISQNMAIYNIPIRANNLVSIAPKLKQLITKKTIKYPIKPKIICIKEKKSIGFIPISFLSRVKILDKIIVAIWNISSSDL